MNITAIFWEIKKLTIETSSTTFMMLKKVIDCQELKSSLLQRASPITKTIFMMSLRPLKK